MFSSYGEKMTLLCGIIIICIVALIASPLIIITGAGCLIWKQIGKSNIEKIFYKQKKDKGLTTCPYRHSSEFVSKHVKVNSIVCGWCDHYRGEGRLLWWKYILCDAKRNGK